MYIFCGVFGVCFTFFLFHQLGYCKFNRFNFEESNDKEEYEVLTGTIDEVNNKVPEILKNVWRYRDKPYVLVSGSSFYLIPRKHHEKHQMLMDELIEFTN